MPVLIVFLSLLPGSATAPPGAPPETTSSAGLPRAHPDVRVHAAPRPRSARAVGEDWPSLYGPRRDGRTRETALSREWPEGEPKLLWELERGDGYVSPVIVGDRLVYLHRRGDTVIVECLRPVDGRRWWEFRFESVFSGEIIRNNGPRASAVLAGGRVFVHDIAGTLYCLGLDDGKPRWQRDLQEEFDVPSSFFGVCSTPLPWEDLLIVNVGAGKDGPCVVAFDQASGEQVWGSEALGGASCSSPIATTHGGRPWVFVFTGGKSRPPVGGLVALHPRTGAVDFEIPWRSRTYYSVNASVPLFLDGRVFLLADKGMGSGMIDVARAASASEGIEGAVLWRNPRVALEFVGAVHRDGRIYVFDGENRANPGLVCMDATNGKELWRERLELAGGARPGQASLLLADGDALCLSDEGTLFWLRLRDDGAEILEQARLFRAAQSWTPPVVHEGLLFIAQNEAEENGPGPRLLAYDLRAAE